MSVLVCGVLVVFGMLCYYQALRYIVIAVFVMAGAILVDWYTSTVLLTPSTLYTVLLSSTTVTLISGIIAAIRFRWSSVQSDAIVT
jgi:hypothetical protein